MEDFGPDELHVLFIEGFCQVPWFQNKFWTCPQICGIRPFGSVKAFRVWCTDPSYLDPSGTNGCEPDIAPDAYGIDKCITEIESGKYHAIVVVDYSNPEDVEEFDEKFGRHLQDFVAAGGAVAFPSSESLLISSLQKMFDVEWKRSDYYRTTWIPYEENLEKVNASFGNGNLACRIIKPYSAKGNTLKNVPIYERCFGVGPDSKTQSLVPMMNGRDVSKGESKDDDCDTIVAMHEYGKGVVAYFGDVNAEESTLWLVAAFIESRSPKLPIDTFSKLSESEISEVMKYKEEGNVAFGGSDLDLAEVKYKSALGIFGSRLGSNGAQRETYVALVSNLSLAYLKKKLYVEAEMMASNGLDAEWGHGKCSYRRAMAKLQISLNTKGGDLRRLREAKKDVINCDPGEATRTLLLRIKKEEKKLMKKERHHFSSGFAAAMSGTL